VGVGGVGSWQTIWFNFVGIPATSNVQ
jgi:hypothetical protein